MTEQADGETRGQRLKNLQRRDAHRSDMPNTGSRGLDIERIRANAHGTATHQHVERRFQALSRCSIGFDGGSEVEQEATVMLQMDAKFGPVLNRYILPAPWAGSHIRPRHT